MKTYMLKSMAELLADGWTVAGDPTLGKRLEKPGSVGLNERLWSRLGSAIGLTKDLDGKPGLYCVERVQWSKHLIKYPMESGAPRPAAVPPCTCDTKLLFDSGCQCGGFHREQLARRA